jgi:hypothetical protein
VTSGTYAHTLDMLNAGSYNPAFVTAHGAGASFPPPGMERKSIVTVARILTIFIALLLGR